MEPDDSVDPDKVHFVEVNGLRTRYYDSGTAGETLILFHGGNPGFLASLDTWSRNLRGLQSRFRVVAPDAPGQGFTDPPVADQDFTWDYMVQHTLAWILSLGLDQFHVVGHSRGGLMAAEVAVRRPDHVRSLVAVDSGSLAPDPTDPSLATGAWFARLPTAHHRGAWSREELRVEPEATSVTHGHITEDFIDRQQTISELPSFREAEARMRDRLEARVWEPSVTTARQRMLERLSDRGMPCPTLVTWGGQDRGSPLMSVGIPLYELVARHTARAELHVISQSGHYPCREHPHIFNRLVECFCHRD